MLYLVLGCITKVFKSCVKNTNRTEGCIVENYNVEETIKFCARYVEGMEVEVGQYGKALSSGTSIELDKTSLLQAHRWVLHNIDEIQPWIE